MTRKAGAIVIDALRQRIRLGRYFGRWAAGDRLPSVREIARLERVDRKTAAAAYRQLEAEGLVRVQPRSGVYLAEQPASTHGNPLARLHAQWLDNAMATAEDLGLDADSVHRMFQAVAAVRRDTIPVVDPDPDHAALLADELRERTALDCLATAPGDVARNRIDRMPPFLLVTPAGARALGTSARRIPAVLIALNPRLLDQTVEAARGGSVYVVVGSRALQRDLRLLLDGDGAGGSHSRFMIERSPPADSSGDGATPVIHWPGADGAARRATRPTDRRLVSDLTLTRIRAQVGRAALARVSTSTDDATPR